MRRFVRTFFVRRAGQYSVMQDSAVRQFEVWHWSAATGLAVVGRYPYAPGAQAFRYVRDVAIKDAKRLAEAGLLAVGIAEPAVPADGDVTCEEFVVPVTVVDTTAVALGLQARRRPTREDLS